MNKLRVGILGAARITPEALIAPSVAIDSIEIVRVAARDRGRAEAFAATHDIPNVSADYLAVIEADDVDVVYNPLPMSHHAEWSIKALRAGKHVLCEKPFASNADEAAEMVRVADQEERILCEAFHYYYHPMFHRILDEVASGRIGDLIRVEGHFDITIPQPDLRWEFATSGGSTMDLGCYPVHWLRSVTGEEPTVVSAKAEIGPPDIDAALEAEVTFPSGVTGYIHSAMNDPASKILLTIEGTKGRITADNPLAPQNGNKLTIETENATVVGSIEAGTTYHHMMRAFADHVLLGAAFQTKGQDSIANMAAIDAMYIAAGMTIRGR